MRTTVQYPTTAVCQVKVALLADLDLITVIQICLNIPKNGQGKAPFIVKTLKILHRGAWLDADLV